jgi:hypothetical protein
MLYNTLAARRSRRLSLVVHTPRSYLHARARGSQRDRSDLGDVRVTGPPEGQCRRLGLQALLHELGISLSPLNHLPRRFPVIINKYPSEKISVIQR